MRRPAALTLAGAVLTLAGVVLTLAGAVLTLAGPAAAATPSAEPGPPRVVERTVTDPRISESSGLVASRRTPGVLWTFDDSGGGPELFALTRSGRVGAVVTLSGVTARDWEAATSLAGPDGAPLLAVGDVGDNAGARPSVQVHVLAEPAAGRDRTVRPLRTLELTYPDRPVDAEALVADPATGRLYVVTKGLLGGRLYAVPASAWPGDATTPRVVRARLELVARVPLAMVTDGVALPDGRVALRTYGELALMPPLPTPAAPDDADDADDAGAAGDADDAADVGVWAPLATTMLPRQGQGEGIGLGRDGAFLLSTEGVGKPVLTFSPPPDVRAAGSPSPAGEPSQAPPSGTPGPSGAGGGPPAVASSSSVRLSLPGPLAGVGAALAVVVGAVVVGAVVVRSRRVARRRR